MSAVRSLNLGSLTSVELREYWGDEARDFTPWLSQAENLALLGEAIGLDLELVGREQPVGGFKVDIVARDTVSNRLVVIENQLERTNHGHLGQLLTYAAGYDAIAVVWVAKHVCEEYRKALDWLNDKTSDELAFFAVEMELWRIGNSAPAPKFNIVSQPNEWGRAVRPGVANQNEPTETKILQQEFWEAMVENFKANKVPFTLRKARAQQWYDIAIGSSNAHLSLTVNSKENLFTCGLYIKGKRAKTAFSELFEQKEAIEKELGPHLHWLELPQRRASRILQVKEGEFENRDKWGDYFAWLRNRSEAFYKAFGKRVALLNLNGGEDEAE